MFNGIFRVPQPLNEPCLNYAPGSPERTQLKAKLKDMLSQQVEVPMITSLANTIRPMPYMSARPLMPPRKPRKPGAICPGSPVRPSF